MWTTFTTSRPGDLTGSFGSVVVPGPGGSFGWPIVQDPGGFFKYPSECQWVLSFPIIPGPDGSFGYPIVPRPNGSSGSPAIPGPWWFLWFPYNHRPWWIFRLTNHPGPWWTHSNTMRNHSPPSDTGIRHQNKWTTIAACEGKITNNEHTYPQCNKKHTGYKRDTVRKMHLDISIHNLCKLANKATLHDNGFQSNNVVVSD